MLTDSPRARFRIAALTRSHDRQGFACGIEALDRYLRQQAGQDARRRVTSVFVAEDPSDGSIAGFYTLSMAAVRLDALPRDVAARMPRYPTVPAVRLGRLAVSLSAQGTGLGACLLIDAIARSHESQVAWATFVVDAKGAKARSFYTKFGFQALADDPDHLFLMRATIEPLLARHPVS